MDSLQVAVYDDRCSLCATFARSVGFLARGKIQLVGHYTPLGEKLRSGEILGPGAPEMFWLIDGNTAFGGRAALWPLLRSIMSCGGGGGRRRGRSLGDGGKSLLPHTSKESGPGAAGASGSCQAPSCSGPKGVFIRSASIVRNSRTVRVQSGQF